MQAKPEIREVSVAEGLALVGLEGQPTGKVRVAGLGPHNSPRYLTFTFVDGQHRTVRGVLATAQVILREDGTPSVVTFKVTA